MTKLKNLEEKTPNTNQAPLNASLGAFIKKARQDVSMSLRDVEESTKREISNSYLSQLEGGKINKPSPHILYTLSSVLGVDYENLMQRAGYILPGAKSYKSRSLEQKESYVIDNLTAEEESQLLEYLSFLRSKKKK